MIKEERLSPLLFLLLILRLGANGIVLILALCFTPATTMLGIPWVGYTWENTYIFVWPMVLIVATTLLFDVLSLIKEEARETMFWRSLLFAPLMVMAWWFPFLLRLWPGGDDGGGFAWILILGSACVFAVMISALGAIQTLRTGMTDQHSQGWPSSKRAKINITWCVSITAVLLVFQVCRWWYSVL